jgi:putative sigma-54 modulation protein
VIRPLLRFFDDPAAELQVHLADVRPRRGADQECRMSFRLPGARTLHVESTQPEIREAMRDAVLRMKRLMKRELTEMRAGGRQVAHRAPRAPVARALQPARDHPGG